METAPLTLAHVHARNASSETQKANIIAAREEHELAAGEFANAVRDVADLEARRILKLLEDEHRKLAHIIKVQAQSQQTSAQPSSTDKEPSSAHQPSSSTTTSASVASLPPSESNAPLLSPSKAATQAKAQRAPSSSIASNLASARGIPSPRRRRAEPVSPTLSAQQAGGKLIPREERGLSPESQLRSSTTKRRTAGREKPRSKLDGSGPAGNIGSQATKETSVAPVKNEEPFQRFFSTFESLFSKLSAPLAYAGLPLTVEEPVPEEPRAATEKKSREKTTVNTPGEPNLTQIFSQAALRALKEDHGPNAPFGGGESFYVVPTTGGTVSYAGILSRAEQDARERHNLADVTEESGEDGSGSFDHFVDASEMPALPSPRSVRSRQPTLKHQGSSSLTNSGTARVTPRAGAGGGKKTMEELNLENSALRQLLDTQSRRLQMWEASAQSQSQALAQSFRAMQPAISPEPTQQAHSRGTVKPAAAASSVAPGPVSDATPEPNSSEPPAVVAAAAALAAEERTRRLEEQVRATQREMEACAAENAKFARENEKLRTVVGRYREKWEQLKAGARMRRETSTATATDSPTLGNDDPEKEGEGNSLVEG